MRVLEDVSSEGAKQLKTFITRELKHRDLASFFYQESIQRMRCTSRQKKYETAVLNLPEPLEAHPFKEQF